MRALRNLIARLLTIRARNLRKHGHWADGHHYCSLAARCGLEEAQHELARDYDLGRGCTRSGSEAVRWYRAAAEQGHVEAQFELGIILLGGRDTAWCAGPSARWVVRASASNSPLVEQIFPSGVRIEKDEAQAYQWLRKAAEGGKPEAQANLGWLLLKGIGCESDRTEARSWLERAVERDMHQAALGLSEFFGDKSAPEYNEEDCRKWLRKAADQGNVSAAYSLGLILKEQGKQSEAEVYLTIAADKNHAAACRELGRLIIARAGDKGAERGAEYLRRAAKAGHAAAAAELGAHYTHGNHVQPDLREAAKWLRQAADAGVTQAQFQVACLFARGEGVPKDLQHAATYFRLSAEGGHSTGALNLAIFLEGGQGVPQDLEASAKWLEVAARGGISQAQVRLAHLKASGRLGEADAAAAVDLFEQAVKKDNPEAEFALAKILIGRESASDKTRAVQLLSSAVGKGFVPAAEGIAFYADPSVFESVVLAKAVNVLEDAAQGGQTQAQIALARLLIRGQHIRRNLDRAENLLKEATEQGSAVAHFELGVLYCQRQKAPGDLERGFNHYRLSGELGHTLGQFNTAIMLLNGTGVDQDRDEALAWLRRAADAGLAKAKARLEKLVAEDGAQHAAPAAAAAS